MNENLKSCNLTEMEALFKEMGQPKFRAKQVYTWLHKGVPPMTRCPICPRTSGRS